MATPVGIFLFSGSMRIFAMAVFPFLLGFLAREFIAEHRTDLFARGRFSGLIFADDHHFVTIIEIGSVVALRGSRFLANQNEILNLGDQHQDETDQDQGDRSVGQNQSADIENAIVTKLPGEEEEARVFNNIAISGGHIFEKARLENDDSESGRNRTSKKPR